MTVTRTGVWVKSFNRLLYATSIGACLLSCAACGGFDVTVTKSSWIAGLSDVNGTITNGTGSGCTDPEITLHLRDHNGAIVRDFTFGAGDLADGQKRNWSTHMVGTLMFDAPVESNVTTIDADATCADQH